MKRILITAILSANVLLIKAQTQPACNPYPKTISVTGSSEMEIVPDEIYVRIDLKEYKKKGENKVELEKIKSDFLAKCSSIGLPDSVISIASYEGANYNYWYLKRRKKDAEMYAGISYQLKFKDSKKMDQLIDVLDDEATANFQIVKASHSKIQEYRKQLKILAVKAAKDKGIYLTEAINERLGEAVTIEEPDENTFLMEALENNVTQSVYTNSLAKDRVNFDDNEKGTIDFKKIKLRYEVKIVFAVK